MGKRAPLVIGGVLVVVAVVVGVILIGGKGSSTKALTLSCIGGSEKQELMADPQVAKILNDKYHLVVDYNPMGSYDQVQLSTSELQSRKVDCLWPASSSAQLIFEKTHSTGTDFPGYRAESILQTPEVIYSGPEGTKALLAKNVVQDRGGKYFIVDMQKLLIDYVLKHLTWTGIGAKQIGGPIAITSTDPAKSNSGFTMSQLELIIAATKGSYQQPSLAQARLALPVVHRLYEAEGLQSTSSDFGFDQWLLQGGELHAPLYAGYESQIIGKVVSYASNQSALQQLLASTRILYPEPTIYADNPLLALNTNAQKLIEAMKDPDIQKIAWEQYGFRSGVSIGTDVSYFKSLSLAAQLRTISAPSADVTQLLLRCIQQNVCT